MGSSSNFEGNAATRPCPPPLLPARLQPRAAGTQSVAKGSSESDAERKEHLASAEAAAGNAQDALPANLPEALVYDDCDTVMVGAPLFRINPLHEPSRS
jgi:hypothetical protein